MVQIMYLFQLQLPEIQTRRSLKSSCATLSRLLMCKKLLLTFPMHPKDPIPSRLQQSVVLALRRPARLTCENRSRKPPGHSQTGG